MRINRTLAWRAAAIAAVGAWVYAPALRGGWVWDDVNEVVRNPALPDARGLWKIWLKPAGPDYFPLKTTVQWVEWRLWGAEPAGYHWVSLVLHLASALLFWRLLAMLRPGAPAGPRLEWLGGLLLVVHPLAVESVAWIAELKNTLSLPLLLVSMIAWVDFDRTRRRRSYLLSWLAFLLAVLAKSTVVMFPCVIVLYAWWRRRRIAGTAWLEAAPFFGVALALGLVTVRFQSQFAIRGADLDIGGLGSRLAGAGLAMAFYLGKCVFPVGLMPLYPRWDVTPPSPGQYWPWLALAALAAWLWTKREGWGRGALFGLGFFVLNLLPVLGLVPMAYLRISWVADHFAYLPMLGLIGIAIGGANALAGSLAGRRRPLLRPASAVAAAIVALLAWISRGRAAIYRGDETFWRFALERNPSAWLAQNDLGEILLDSGRVPEALEHLEAAVRLRPDYPEARNNLGNALARSGRLPEAIGEFVAALRLEPNYVMARENLSDALIQSGRYEDAIAQLDQVLTLRPDLPEAQASLAFALEAVGRLPEAIAHYERARQLAPADLRVRRGLGVALARSGRLEEAIAEFRAAVRLAPGDAESHYDLGLALRMAGRPSEADGEFRAAGRLRPGY